MPETRDRDALRAILAVDPYWTLYALGDLAPGYFEDCSWYCSDSSVVMLFRAARTPVLFAAGDPQDVARLVEEIAEPAVYLHVRPDTAAAIAPRYRGEARPMWRMVLDAARFRPERCAGCARLDRNDVPAIERLYADGRGCRDTPVFSPRLVEKGLFFGVREGGELAAVAGMHVVSPEEGVAAIGNVYTRRDRRGRGLAGALTSAVAGELFRMGVRTVGLNVARDNAAAIRVYERLGFVVYCDFIEGPAVLQV
jgi:RimJ/RimL family protein N-acetyltransferase